MENLYFIYLVGSIVCFSASVVLLMLNSKYLQRSNWDVPQAVIMSIILAAVWPITTVTYITIRITKHIRNKRYRKKELQMIEEFLRREGKL